MRPLRLFFTRSIAERLGSHIMRLLRPEVDNAWPPPAPEFRSASFLLFWRRPCHVAPE